MSGEPCRLPRVAAISKRVNQDPARVAAGLKATIHNPNTSEEAKDRAAQRLETMGETPAQETHLTNREAGGYKATLQNEHASEKAKQHAREILEADGYSVRPADSTDEAHRVRVMAGYKAALHNPRVSDDAKEHAREVLKQNGEL